MTPMRIITSSSRLCAAAVLVILSGLATSMAADRSEGRLGLVFLVASAALFWLEVACAIVDHLRADSTPG